MAVAEDEEDESGGATADVAVLDVAELEVCVGSGDVEEEVFRLLLNTPRPPSVPRTTDKIMTIATTPTVTTTNFRLYHGRLPSWGQ